jgi:hypothetical protein
MHFETPLLVLAGALAASLAAAAAPPDLTAASAAAQAALRAKHGEAEGARIDRGIAQVRRLWRAEDGDAAAFQDFVTAEFVPAGPELDRTFARFEEVMESFDGYFVAMGRDVRKGNDLDLGPLLALDRRLAGMSPSAHLSDDLFANKVAFVALLNFPLTTLDQRLKDGGSWSRRQWAETRLAHRFGSRVPAEIAAGQAEAYARGEEYINGYNVYMHHLVDAQGTRLFPERLRLISHWNLRDELKAAYADKGGLPRQRMIAQVMERIVTQQIPAAVVNNPLLDWNPFTNAVTVSPVHDEKEPPASARAEAKSDPEPDLRYQTWLGIFHAERAADPYSPDEPTFVDRRFNVSREIPKAEVRALIESLLSAPVGKDVAALVAKRLGRPLEPFDIWYAGFKPRGKYTEAELDALTKARYPTSDAYAKDMPRLLHDLGFSDEKARFLADHIVVDPSRGAGHALGAGRRDDKSHLRTRVGRDGMDYKGYNIAVHEMGHNVEQVFSLTTIDHTLLAGVPNNAFTEALAFVFQGRDLRLLGLPGEGPEGERLKALETFWSAREIAGASLVDMEAWDWLYAHPDATPAQFREAVVAISRGVWNRYYAPLFGAKDVAIIGIYSHMVSYGLYLPDYTLGHLIAFQVEDHFKKSTDPLGVEFERVSRIGSITPDAWIRQAVGAPLSAEPLIAAARAAVAELPK